MPHRRTAEAPYRENIRRNALRARLVREGLCSRRQAQALSDDDVESVHAGLRKNWPRPRRPRRHDRLHGAETTLCGRSAFGVLLARAGAPYPRDRANCRRCYDVSIANMTKAFARVSTSSPDDDFDLRAEGRKTQPGRPSM